MNVTLLPEAEQDLTKGALYYAREAGLELSPAFIAQRFAREVSQQQQGGAA